MTRPDREVIARWVFDEQWQLRPTAKKKLIRVATCTRRAHTIAWGLPTPHGWWVAWRQTYKQVPRVSGERRIGLSADGKADRWEYDWADQVTGYTEATCHCRRARRVDEAIARLDPVR
jgi:hypothetical protein